MPLKHSAMTHSSERDRPELSIVVPVYNEEENVLPMTEAVRGSLAEMGPWELVFVDDGSTDETAPRVRAVAREDDRVRLVRLSRNYGQTLAMQAGFDHSRGEIVVTIDGDLQNDPRDIPRLVAKLREGYDLVAGYRENRKDPFLTRRLPSMVANWLIRRVTSVPTRDTGCSLKAYRRSLIDRLPLYSDLHRFLPALAAGTAAARITEIPVRHHERRYGTTKYGLRRVVQTLADLLTILMIRSFRERPLTLFGFGAGAAAALGMVFGLLFLVVFLTTGGSDANAFVLPGTGILWLLLSGYLLMLGLVCEVIVRKVRERRRDLPIAAEYRPPGDAVVATGRATDPDPGPGPASE